MRVLELIEDLVVREVKGLCVTCVHADGCIYHKTATKKIIQCELFELSLGQSIDSISRKGLCTTCDNASYCKLPGRKEGVWRCNEFV
jgi:hypothetical protein